MRVTKRQLLDEALHEHCTSASPVRLESCSGRRHPGAPTLPCCESSGKNVGVDTRAGRERPSRQGPCEHQGCQANPFRRSTCVKLRVSQAGKAGRVVVDNNTLGNRDKGVI